MLTTEFVAGALIGAWVMFLFLVLVFVCYYGRNDRAAYDKLTNEYIQALEDENVTLRSFVPFVHPDENLVTEELVLQSLGTVLWRAN